MLDVLPLLARHIRCALLVILIGRMVTGAAQDASLLPGYGVDGGSLGSDLDIGICYNSLSP